MDKYSKVMCDIELLVLKWANEYAKMVIEDTQPSRENIRAHVQDLRKIIRDNTDYTKIEELIYYACSE